METILITGGSSGIGYELSKHFAKNGYKLLWVSRPEKELMEAKTKLLSLYPETIIETLALDLTQETAPIELLKWSTEVGSVDILVNNAGIGTYGFLQNIPIEQEVKMIELNVMATYKMTRLFLQQMLEKDKGCIINVSSITAFNPITRMNTYASTKAFVLHFTQGLKEELRLQGANVRIMAVCPAAISDTPFKTKSKMDQVRTFEGLAATTSEEVAKDIWNGYQKGKTFIVTGRRMRWLYAIQHLIPNRVLQAIVNWESSKK